MADRALLEAYQRHLLAALHRYSDPEDVRQALLAAPELAPLRGWLEACEPRMLEVAIALTRHWSARREP